MIVHHTVDLGEGHLIEFGAATWDESQTSIRNRYPTSTGGFSPRSSSEIPIRDMVRLTIETFRHDLMTIREATDIIRAAAEFIERQAT